MSRGPAGVTGDLPEHLRERVRRVGGVGEAGEGDFVLYWMRTALRGHENPALDVALRIAERRALQKALKRASGNRAETARILGVSRRKLYYMLREHDLP